MLLGNIGPVSGSSDYSLSIDGSKSSIVAELETGSIGGHIIKSQYADIRGVGNQILYISP